METYALYTLAARHGVAALSICAITDLVMSGDHLPAADRQSSLRELAELVLAVAVSA
jgi:purine-nucleoside phosphorylase